MGNATLAANATYDDDIRKLITNERKRRCDASRRKRDDGRQRRRSELVDDDRSVWLSTSVHSRAIAVHFSASGKTPCFQKERSLTVNILSSNNTSRCYKLIHKQPRTSSCRSPQTSPFRHRQSFPHRPDKLKNRKLMPSSRRNSCSTSITIRHRNPFSYCSNFRQTVNSNSK